MKEPSVLQSSATLVAAKTHFNFNRYRYAASTKTKYFGQ
jgi:hypothetical protein